MTIVGLFRRFFPYLQDIQRQAILNVFLVLLVPAFGAALLWSFKFLIDDVLVAGRSDDLAPFALAYVIAAVGRTLTQYAAQAVEANAIENVLLAVRSDVYAHALSLSPGSAPKSSSGDILSRLEGDTIRTETLIYAAPIVAIADAVAVLVYASLLFILNWKLTICALTALPIIAFLINRISPLVRKAARISRRAEAGWMSLAEERLNALSIVQSFDAETREAHAFRHRAAKVRRMEAASLVLQARQSALVEAAIVITGLGVFALGAALIKANALSVGELVAFLGTVGSLYAPVNSLAKTAGRFQNAAAGAQRIADFLDIESRVRQAAIPQALLNPQGAIEFRDVSFTYPGAVSPCLSGLSFKIEPGETVGIVGPSGSGKSSLVRLLLRQYDVDAGAIFIDGRDVRGLSLSSLRATVAPVMQDAHIFRGSIARNVRYGAPDAVPSAVVDAARAAAVDRFADQKHGLSTPAGISGNLLSGGQRQRIALARALIRDAPVLVLDEATAGVDSETEDVIQGTLQRIAGQKTVLVVAHRLSSIRHADRVIVLEHGRVVETGTPDALFNSPSRARQIFGNQVAPREAAE